MSRIARVLLLVVAAELAIAGYVAIRRATAVRPPPVNLERLDRRTAAELRELQANIRTSDRASWEQLALAYLSFGYFAEAEACFSHAAQIEPPTHELLLSWATCLDRLGRLDEAAARFEQAAAITDGRRRDVCLYHIGRCQLRKLDLDQARRAFIAAGDFELARYQLAKLQARTGHADEAATILDAMLIRNPLELKLNQLRAKVATELGDAATARRCRDLLERSQERLFVDSTVEYIGLLRARRGLPHVRAQTAELEQSGQHAAAADELNAAQKLEWDLATARRLVRLNVRLGRLDDAAAVLAEMTDRFGASPEFLEQQGDVAFLQQRGGEAAELWQRAVALRPSSRLHQLLADEADRRGDAAAATRHRARSELHLGLQHFRQNREVEAFKHFQTGVELDPRQPDTWFYMGEVQRIAGHVDEAAAAYRRCLELRPQSGRALDALARLGAAPPGP